MSLRGWAVIAGFAFVVGLAIGAWAVAISAGRWVWAALQAAL